MIWMMMFLRKYNYWLVLVGVFVISFAITYLLVGSNSLTKIEFEKDVYSLDTVALASSTNVKIKYFNKGSLPLKLEDVSAPCGCILVDWNNNNIAPKQQDSILITFNAENIVFFSKLIYVFSNVEKSPNVIFIEGVVK